MAVENTGDAVGCAETTRSGTAGLAAYFGGESCCIRHGCRVYAVKIELPQGLRNRPLIR
jgi:hypothetical protein